MLEKSPFEIQKYFCLTFSFCFKTLQVYTGYGLLISVCLVQAYIVVLLPTLNADQLLDHINQSLNIVDYNIIVQEN